MSRSRRSVLAGLGALPLLACSPLGGEHRPPRLPRTTRVSVPAIDHDALADGPELRIFEDHGVPLVSMAVAVRAGYHHEPAGQEGLVRLVGSLLGEGLGGGDRAALLDRYGDLGATPHSFVSRSLVALHCTAHADDAPAALSLLVDNLRRPTLAEAAFQRLRREQRELVAASRGDPGRIAGLSVVLGVTGLEPPTAALPDGTPRSIAGLRLDAARAWLDAHVRPDALVVLLAGAVDRGAALGWIDAATRGWSSTGRPAAAPAVTDASSAGPRTVLVPWPSLPQTMIALGSPRARLGHADEPAEQVASAMVGSLLHHELRTRQRTTYAVEPSTWDTRRGLVHRIEAKVEPAGVPRALDGTLERVERLVQDPIIVARAFDDIRRSLVMEVMDDHHGPEAALRQLLRVAAEGLPPDAAARRLERLERLDASDMQAALQRCFEPRALRLAVVGDPDSLAAAREVLPREDVVERRLAELVGPEPEAPRVEPV